MPETDPAPRGNPPPPPPADPAPAPAAPPPNFEWLPPVIGTVRPPTLAPSALQEPPPLPLQPHPEGSGAPKAIGPWLLTATIATALLVTVVVLHAAHRDPQNSGVAYTIGMLLGALVLYPAVPLGILSLFRRFRNGRSRCIILLSCWALIALALVSNPAHRNVPRRVGNPAVADRTATPAPAAGRPALPASLTVSRPPPAASSRAAFDFSRGSDVRLIKQIENAQESAYHEIVHGYAAACAERPDDALLALERVRFIERFAYAEDLTFASAESDLAEATAYLETAFPAAPSTQLHQLERAYGEAFDEKVDTVWPAVAGWNASDRAQFWLLRAQRAAEGSPEEDRFAANAFEANPTADAALRHARGLLKKSDVTGARTVLLHPILADLPEWQQNQRLKLLLEAGAVAEGIELWERLEKSAPAQVHTTEVAKLLARAGRIDLARQTYARIPTQKWNARTVAQERFAFELEHGTGAEAATAYRALRSAGFEADPFARERMSLLLKHPQAGWHLDEVGSFLALGFLTLLAAMLPLVVLAPVHYWGLWRRARGRVAEWTLSPWGLRAAWFALAAVAIGALAGIWWFQPATVRSWVLEAQARPPVRALAPRELLGPVFVMWSVALSTVALLLLLARKGSLLGPGSWSWGKASGLGCGLALLLKVGLGVYITVLGLKGLGMAEVTPLSTQFFGTAYRTLGPLGFCALVAVFVPIFEEALFRGILLGAFAKHLPFWIANAFQSLVFLALHEEMRVAPFFFALAFVNGELVRRSRGLLPGIVVHIVNNALACIFVMTRGGV
ncbi:MAG: CPBP family intramembrane metalloprotease [Candidatus Didemnitutus sp.]|nr:CPBP family intramembrane metalloprotease [Candidatus Didemnitutus sp.]